MSTINSPVARISEDEGKFFIDWEKQLNALTKPTGEGADQKAALFSDAEVTKFTDTLGEKLKAKSFNVGDLAFVAQSFTNELNSGKPSFSTMEKRLDLFGQNTEVAVAAVPKSEDDGGDSTNVSVTVNLGGNRPTTGTTGSTTNRPSQMSDLGSTFYSALKSMDNVNYSLQKAIRAGQINQFSIGTMEQPGAWTKNSKINLSGLGYVVGPNMSASQMNLAIIEALNAMLDDYKDELAEARYT